MVKKSQSTAVAVQQDKKNVVSTMDAAPDYLTGEKAHGTEGLGQSDFKIPRIKLLQPLNPEVRSFPGVAIPGKFWHTGANKSLGDEFLFITCIVTKRVILWNHRDNGGGILAFSNDGVNWSSGGNQKFTVKIKGQRDPIIYDTKKNVHASRLTEWGSANPADPDAGPAAQIHYEYLLYLPEYPELSPVVMGLTRTAAVNAKSFNTALLMPHKPIQSILVRAFSDEKSKNDNTWWVPNFATQGYVPKEQYEIAKEIAEKSANYQTDIEDDNSTSSSSDVSY